MEEFINAINKAKQYIEEAADIAEGKENVMEYLQKCGVYEETYKSVFWVIDLITKDYQD